MAQQMLRCPEQVVQMEPAVTRMLDAFKDVPGFVSLKKLFIRPFLINSKTANTIRKLYGRSNPPRECSDIRVFCALLIHLTVDEENSHVTPLLEMFKCLVARHRRRVSANSCHCYDKAGDCAIHLLCIALSHAWETSESLLGYFSNELFLAGGIREGNLLMGQSLKDSMLGSVLIRNGFKYTYHQIYYIVCCQKLINTSFVRISQMYEFRRSGNLRKQMAVEILSHLSCREAELSREYLCTLWRSVPDPFINSDELFDMMEHIFKEKFILEVACAQYNQLMPEMPPVKQPRSLKHLARVRIRESIMVSTGEKAVGSLGLPRSIEDYLWKLEAF